MKLNKLIGILLMIVLTASGIILSIGTAVTGVLNSKGIIASMQNANYLEKSETEAKKILGNYMSNEKVEQILQEINIKVQIKEIAAAFDNNTISIVANNMKDEMKQVIASSLDESVSEANKEAFAATISDEYIKTIFPVTELSALSAVYSIYREKLVLILVITAIFAFIIYMYLAFRKRIYRWAIVSLYNINIINIIFILILGMFDGIVIGSERTTAVVSNIISTIKMNVLIATFVTLIITIFSNYIEYFRKKRVKFE